MDEKQQRRDIRNINLVVAGVIVLLIVPMMFALGPASASIPLADTKLDHAQAQLQWCKDLRQFDTRNSTDRAWADTCIRLAQREVDRLSVTAQPTSKPTAPATPSPTPTTPPDPTPAPTTTPPPTPSQSPTTLTNCFPKLAACGYPHPGNTGFPVGAELTPMAPAEVRTAGTVINGRLINGFLKVLAPDVIIRNSKIVMGDNFYGISVEGAGSATIENVEIDCVGGTGNGIQGSDFAARRVNVHDCENGFHTNSNVTIQDSYITGIREVNGGHGDGIQGSSASNVIVRHNTFDLLNPITASIIWDNLTMTNVTVENNFFAAGAYSVYCPTSPTNVTYRGNRFYSPVGNWQSDPHRPAFGFATGCNRPGITWTGNFRDADLGTVNAT